MDRNTFVKLISGGSIGTYLSGVSLNALNSHEHKSRRDKPVTINSRRELFIDHKLIEALNGLELRLHTPIRQPLPKSPIQSAYMTVIKDGDLYRAYYRDNDPGYDGPPFSGNPGEFTAYAESRDGQEWTYPNLGQFEINGTRNNNATLAGQPPFSHNFSPFLDTRPGVNPDERYKALAGHPRRGRPDRPDIPDGLYAFVSGDGIRWNRVGSEPVIPYNPAWSHAFDSQNVAFWSEVEEQYLCYFRTWETPHGRLRTISRIESPDFLNWGEAAATIPNLPEEHLYTSQTSPYYRAPHIYIALPTRFYEQDASTDILFMTSRAGSKYYDRLFTEAFIRPGLDPEQWQNRANYAALNVVPTGPAEMSIYHRSGHRYVLRTDGFVSVRASAAEGELLTRPVIFNGKELEINYSTSAGGKIQVEIQREGGIAVPGFHLQDCPEIKGDEIERRVNWKENSDLRQLKGKPVRIRFVMKESDLYSFRFTNQQV